jgi:hypothetical protein
MLEPASLSALPCTPLALAVYAQPSSAISPEANRLSDAAERVMRERRGVQSFFGAKDILLSDLSSVVAGLHVDEDQESVSPKAFLNVVQFILALPNDLPNPAFGIDPDGEISVTWYVSRTRLFSASVSESERIAYAWMDGSDKGHAVDRFRAPELPARLVSALRSIVADDVLRAA